MFWKRINETVEVVAISTIILVLLAGHAAAQATQFTYQGSLKSGGTVANGNFDFEFVLFDTGGTQLGAPITRNGVAVTDGIFSVTLDFGAQFPGADRLLEVRVRPPNGGAFTTLSPRQPVSSAPYSIKSLTAGTADSAQTASTATNAQNAVNATNATTAVTATNFTGPLAGDVTGSQSATTVGRLRGRNVAGTVPLGGQVLKYNSTTNQWEPDTDIAGTGGGGGTITGVAPGTGLTGGGATGNVTLSIANGGVNTAQLADSGVTDAKINSVSGGKVTGAVANAVNATNAVNAATATNAQNAVNATNATTAVTAATFTGPLAGDVTGTQSATTVAGLRGRSVANTAPALGQVLKYNGAEWAPDTDNTGAGGGGGTITGVTAGTGLTGGGTNGSVTVGIAIGGVNTAQLADNSVTDAKIAGVAGAKVTGTVANATNATTATNAATATNATQLGGVAANQYLQTNGNGSALTNLNATSITTGTLANARLGQIPTANIADNAVTAPKVASGQVVKSLNSLTDNVMLAGSGNITITPTAGNTLTIASAAGGVGGGGTANPTTIPLWTGSAILGDSLITQDNGVVRLPNVVSLTAGVQGNQMAFGSPNGETGISFAGATGRADLRFDGTKVRLVARGAGSGPPPATNGIVIREDGIVGIGTENFGAKLNVFGTVGTCGAAHIGWGAPVSRGCLSALAVTTNDVSENLIEGLNSSGTVFLVNGSGSVGIGTTTLAARLHVSNGSGIDTIRADNGHPSGYAVYGSASGSSINNRGVYGFSQNGTGVLGRTNSNFSNGLGAGVIGEGIGTGNGVGVYGRGGGTLGVGVSGVGDSIGVYGGVCTEPGCGAGTKWAGYFQGDVNVTGAVTGTVIQNSDARLKHGISKLGYGLSEVLRLRPVTWLWNEHPERGEQLGLVAQEVEPLLPELVSTANDAERSKGVNYIGLVPVLVNAIKEQQVEIESQRKKLTTQSKQIGAQAVEIDALKSLVCAGHRRAAVCRNR